MSKQPSRPRKSDLALQHRIRDLLWVHMDGEGATMIAGLLRERKSDVDRALTRLKNKGTVQRFTHHRTHGGTHHNHWRLTKRMLEWFAERARVGMGGVPRFVGPADTDSDGGAS